MYFSRAIKFLSFTALSVVLSAPVTLAQTSKVPPLSLTKTMVNAAKDSLVSFRNYNGKQLVYFSIILTHHCNLKSLRYKVNNEEEWQDWSLPKCHPQLPYNVDPTKDPVYFSERLGSVKNVTVELVYKDGSKAPVWNYIPCENVGEASCSSRVEASQ